MPFLREQLKSSEPLEARLAEIMRQPPGFNLLSDFRRGGCYRLDMTSDGELLRRYTMKLRKAVCR